MNLRRQLRVHLHHLLELLSFALLLGTIYAWLILLSIINRRVAGDEPLQKLVRLHLGWIDRWPPLLQAALPALITAAIWGFSHSSLVRLGIVPVPSSQAQVWQEALLLGVSSWLVWKPLVLLLCVLYVIQSYVYLGEAPFWRFINTSGTNLLGPLRRLPIAIGKLDLAPLVVMALVFGIGHWAARWLPKLFQQLPLP